MNKFKLKFFYPNLEKHDVTEDEAIQALSDPYRLLNRIGTKDDPRYLVIGKTDEGRTLEIIFRFDKPNVHFVFHTMDARSHQIKRYNKNRTG